MSLSLAIILIVVLDAALIGLLAFVMSRASRLTPHVSPVDAAPQATTTAETARAQQPLRTAWRAARVGGSAIPARS